MQAGEKASISPFEIHSSHPKRLMIPMHSSPVTNAGERNIEYCSYGYSVLCGFRALTQY